MDDNLLYYIPDDLLVKTISTLCLPDILRLASTSSRFNKACRSALNQIRPICLYLYDSSATNGCDIVSIYDTTSQTHVDLVWNKVKNNCGVVKFLKTVWKNVYCYLSEQHDIDTIMHHLQLQRHRLHNIRLLSNKTHSNLNNIAYLRNLQWIDTEYLHKTQWNTLIQNCSKLHGISFVYNTKKERHLTDDCDDSWSFAPDLWSLSIHFEGDTMSTTDMEIVDNMLQCAPALKYLQMTGSHSLYTDDASNNIVHVPSDLIALKAGFECLMGIKFDISSCTELRLIDLELMFFTEDIEIDDHRDYHRPLTALLVDFLEINMYKSYGKMIGVSLGYENGTPTVNKLEKLAAIDEFKSIVEESAADVMNVYRDDLDHNQLQIISTPCFVSHATDNMVSAWCESIFSIQKEQIINVHDTNIFLYAVLSEVKHKMNKQMLRFFEQIVDLGLY